MKEIARRSFLMNAGAGIGVSAAALTLPLFLQSRADKALHEDKKLR